MIQIKTELLSKLEKLSDKINYNNRGNDVVTINSSAFDSEDNVYNLSVECEIIKDQSIISKVVATDYHILGIYLFKNTGDNAPFSISREELYDVIIL